MMMMMMMMMNGVFVRGGKGARHRNLPAGDVS
jgi:hypothetical protein